VRRIFRKESVETGAGGVELFVIEGGFCRVVLVGRFICEESGGTQKDGGQRKKFEPIHEFSAIESI